MRVYTVSKDKNGWYYAHMTGYPNIPVFGSFSKSRKNALTWAANSMGLTYAEYMEAKKTGRIKIS